MVPTSTVILLPASQDHDWLEGLHQTRYGSLEDLDLICAALDCTVADLLQAETQAIKADLDRDKQKAVGAAGPKGARPVPKPGGSGRRSLPPN